MCKKRSSLNISGSMLFRRKGKCYSKQTFLTLNACILVMGAVMRSNAAVRTVPNVQLIPITLNIIKPNLTAALTVMGIAKCCYRFTKSQHATNDLGIVDIEGIIADCSPLAIVIQFHATFKGVVSAYKANVFGR